MPQKQRQQALRAFLLKVPAPADTETLHHLAYRSILPQCRCQSNDNIISGYISALSITYYIDHQYNIQHKTITSALHSLLLIFPNHYFW